MNLSAQTAKAVLITESNNAQVNRKTSWCSQENGIVNLARQHKLCFLRHDNIFEYINRFTPEGVLSSAILSLCNNKRLYSKKFWTDCISTITTFSQSILTLIGHLVN